MEKVISKKHRFPPAEKHTFRQALSLGDLGTFTGKTPERPP